MTDEDAREPDEETESDSGTEPTENGSFFDEPPGRSEEGSDVETDDDSPLSDLAKQVKDRRAAAEEAGDTDLFEAAFEDVGVDSAGPETLWDELESAGLESPIEEPQADSERNLYVISKREYCQRCQFFSTPPEVRCTYDGADILELEDSEHFKVADCPIVEGVEELRKTR